MSDHAQKGEGDSDAGVFITAPTEYEDVSLRGQVGILKLSEDRLTFHAPQTGRFKEILFSSVVKTQHASATRSTKLKHLIKIKLKDGGEQQDAILEFTDRVVLEIVRDDLKERLKTWKEKIKQQQQQLEESPAINQTHVKASRRASTPYSMNNNNNIQQQQEQQSENDQWEDEEELEDLPPETATAPRRSSTPYSMSNPNIREEGAAVELAKNRAREEVKINAARQAMKKAEEDAAKAIAERKRKERLAEQKRQQQEEADRRLAAAEEEERKALEEAAKEEAQAQRQLEKEAAALQQALARAEQEEQERRIAAAEEKAARLKAERIVREKANQARADAQRKAEAKRQGQQQREQQQRAAAEEQARKERATAQQNRSPHPASIRGPPVTEAQKVAAKKRHAQVKSLEDKAHKKANDERLQKWKEQQQKRQQQQQQEKNRQTRRNNNGAAPVVVERVPKLSALLAMGGAGAHEYNQRKAAARLAKWNANGDKWQILNQTYDGRWLSEVTKEEVIREITVEEAMEIFYNNPERYLALHFWPQHPNEFTYILRADTVGYEPQGVRNDKSGQFVLLRHMYQRLPPLRGNILPTPYRDNYTDHMTFAGQKLHSNRNLPLLPGRGMGMGDEANMELMDFPQPGHVRQGSSVGDCWLLSAIACLADFDWAVQRLFRKTKHRLEDCPKDPPNQYTVTLWDLKTWKEVDVVVDERLPVQADGSGHLLGARPSREGKFWVPYLEKAISIHCGGYDKICGGNCTDAWPMMTGSRNQYMIAKNPKTKKYKCCAKFNPQTQQWSQHANSPHDSNPANWPVDWPSVGGGGDREHELTENELFQRIVIWDENNYLLGAGTSGKSDKEKTDGLVDNHAYSIIDSRQNICGTGIDLLLIRNPWGEGGELESGQFMRTGPGWKRYPNIRKELNPVMEDRGLCWVTKSEFFRYFPTIYVCAFNMTRLKDPNYVNDLKNDFKDRPKPGNKKPAAPKAPVAINNNEPVRVRIDKRPYRSSQYKLVEQSFNGGVAFCSLNKKDFHGKSIALGVNEFRSNPKKYLAIHWQNNIVDEGWPPEEHHYTIIYRDGTEGLEIGAAKGGRGKRTILMNVVN